MEEGREHLVPNALLGCRQLEVRGVAHVPTRVQQALAEMSEQLHRPDLDTQKRSRYSYTQHSVAHMRWSTSTDARSTDSRGVGRWSNLMRTCSMIPGAGSVGTHHRDDLTLLLLLGTGSPQRSRG